MAKNSNKTIIKTSRLILRKFTKKDIKALFLIHCDEEVNLYLPWFPLKTLDEAKIFFEQKYDQKYQNENDYKFAICLKDNDIPIGYVDINNDDSHDLGYGLKKEHWNKGIVTEACIALITFLKKTNIKYITATHDINNLKSGQVMRKIGMKYCYSYEEQVQPKNKLITFRMYQINFDDKKDRVYKKYWNNSKVHFIEPNL